MVESEDFQVLLAYCESKKGIYSDTYPESKDAHIQAERNGGNKGWRKLKFLMLHAHEIAARETTEQKEEEIQDYYTEDED